MIGGPEVDVDGVEDAKEREPPGNAINDCFFACWEELVDDCAQEENMDEGPVQGSKQVRGETDGEREYQMRKAQGAGVM